MTTRPSLTLTITKRVWQLRTMLQVHRYLYYVLSQPLVPDAQYDRWERELRDLVAGHADLAPDDRCPLRVPGSSRPADYPLEIVELAERLRAYRPKPEEQVDVVELLYGEL